MQQLLPALLQARCLGLWCRLGHDGCGKRQSEKGRCNGTHLDLPYEIIGKELLSILAVETATLAGLSSLAHISRVPGVYSRTTSPTGSAATRIICSTTRSPALRAIGRRSGRSSGGGAGTRCCRARRSTIGLHVHPVIRLCASRHLTREIEGFFQDRDAYSHRSRTPGRIGGVLTRARFGAFSDPTAVTICLSTTAAPHTYGLLAFDPGPAEP